MADKNKPDSFADKADSISPDDPFAELARLIAPERNREPAEKPSPRAVLPEEDLASDLLREFDQYSAPFGDDDRPRQSSYGGHANDHGYGEDADIAPETFSSQDRVPPVTSGFEPVEQEPSFTGETYDFSGDDLLADELERSMGVYERAPDEQPRFSDWVDEEPQAEPAPVSRGYEPFLPPGTVFEFAPAWGQAHYDEPADPADAYDAEAPENESFDDSGFDDREFDDVGADAAAAGAGIAPDAAFDVAEDEAQDPPLSFDIGELDLELSDPAAEAAEPRRSDDRGTATAEPAGADFNLDLSELEQELSDIEFSADALADENEPLLEAAENQPAAFDDSFDPAALVSTDEPPAIVDELDLPRETHEEPAAAVPDPYEFDLDEELANAMAGQSPVDPLSEAPQYEIDPVSGHSDAYAYDLSDHQPRYDERAENAIESDLDRALLSSTAGRGPQAEYFGDEDEAERRTNWLAVTFMGYGRVLGFGLLGICLVTVAVFAGMRYLSSPESGEPLVITADNSDVKEAPEDPGGEVVPNQDNAVFNNVTGTLNVEPRQGNLIASDEQPTDVESVAPNPLAEASDNPAASDDATDGIQPRKVRTIIVRPDGTLVEREADGADDLTDTSTAEATGPSSAVPSVSTQDATAGLGTFQPEGTAETTTEEPPVVDAAAEQAAAEAAEGAASLGITAPPIPTPRPARPASAPSVAAVSAPPVAPAAQSVAPASQTVASATSASPYAMQIASLPSEQEARQAYTRLASQYPALLGRRAVEFVPATVNGTVYYRVRVTAPSLGEAISLCEQFKAQGGSCFVPRG